ncbi:MAG: hypothetical protein L0H84_16505 [Pseudonocardia sp.]|nr:hypothetical protein [Pseudonocardia sp.]
MPDSSPGKPTADAEIVDAELVEDPVAPAVPTPPIPLAVTGDYDDRGVPSFDYVRAKIEGRAAAAIGHTELAGETEQGRALDEQLAERDRKAKEKLDEIRRSLGG